MVRSVNAGNTGQSPLCWAESWPSRISRSWSPEPRTVTLHHKTDFADTIKLKILRWGDKAGADHNYHNCPDKRQAEGGLKRPP